MDVFSNLNFQNSGIVLDFQTEFPANPNNGTLVLVNGIVYIWTTLAGITTWYPLTSETNYFIHTQVQANVEWTVNHNLGSSDYIFFAYDENNNLITPNYEYIDDNSFKVIFTTAKKGKLVVFIASSTTQAPDNKAGTITVMRTASNYTASSNSLIVCTTKGTTLNVGEYAFTVTLPQNPLDKDVIYIMDGSNSAQERPIKINGNLRNIINAEDFVCDINKFKITLVFDSAENSWSLAT